jgi:hypothetical protein
MQSDKKLNLQKETKNKINSKPGTSDSMLIILATWDAEIGRISVQGHPRQIVWRSHLQNNQ